MYVYMYIIYIYIYISSISHGPKKSGPGTPIAGWFITKIHMKMDDLEVFLHPWIGNLQMWIYVLCSWYEMMVISLRCVRDEMISWRINNKSSRKALNFAQPWKCKSTVHTTDICQLLTHFKTLAPQSHYIPLIVQLYRFQVAIEVGIPWILGTKLWSYTGSCLPSLLVFKPASIKI